MATSARSSSVRVAGTSTIFTTLPMSLVPGTTKTYQLNDATKRVLDPTSATGVDVYDNAVLVDPAQYTVDWMFGRVTFSATYTPATPVTMSGRYFPTAALAEVREHSFTATHEVLDTSAYGSDARTRMAALADLSGSFVCLLTDTADPAGDAPALRTLLGAPFLFEFVYPGGGVFFRAWVIAESVETGASVNGLIETTVNFVGATRATPGEPGEGTGFGWGT